MASNEDTVARLFWNAVAQRGNSVAIRRKTLGVWQGVSWREAGEQVRAAAGALLAHGVARGDRIAILSHNRPEWLFADFAGQSVGAIVQGIDPAEDAAAALQASNAGVVFVENDEQLDRVLRVRDGLSSIRGIVVFDMEGLFGFKDDSVVSFVDFCAAGTQWNSAHAGAVEAAVAAGTGTDTAIITGGAGISQQALLAHGQALLDLIPGEPGDDTISFRTLAGLDERCHAMLRPLLAGSVVNFAEHPDAATFNLREVAPNVLAAPPEFFAKLRAIADLALVESTSGEQRAVAWALALGASIAAHRHEQRAAGLWLAMKFLLADAFVLRRVRIRLGLQRARLLVSEGGALPADLKSWCEALDIEMIEAPVLR